MANGSALAETMISAGILMLTVPWLHLAWSRSAWECKQAAIESLADRLMDATLEQLRCAVHGEPSLLPVTQPGRPLLQDGRILALAFSTDGMLLGCVSEENYQSGCAGVTSGGQPRAACLVRITSDSGDRPALQGDPEYPPAAPIQLTLESPAEQSASMRRKLTFHTRCP